MPTKRKASSPESAQQGSSGDAKRQVSHASRACDGCRRRKMRCDASHPKCTVCQDRGLPCEYKDEDRRKTHVEHMEDMNARMDRFERLIENLVRNLPPATSTIDSQNTGEAVTTSSYDLALTLQNNTLSQPSFSVTPEERPSQSALAYQPEQSSSEGRTDDRALEAHISPSGGRRTARFQNLGEGKVHEQFQRVEESAGTLVQFGPTSLWTCTSPRPRKENLPYDHILQQGDWINWSQHLPKSIDIGRSTHDLALEYFAAFYAPWCFIVDMPAFTVDLARCNLVRASNSSRSPGPTRTAHYSPLLHCCILYLGLVMIRHQYPGLMASYEAVFTQHCSTLLLAECDYPALSSLKAYNLYAK
ncbi:hypothetical protein P7C73_g3150, partial [Tremellales sp. Uapishka_1]